MYQANTLLFVKKRDNRIVPFDENKIVQAINKALREVRDESLDTSQNLADLVVEALNKKFKNGEIPTVEQIQDMVIKILKENQFEDVAKCYQDYRERRAKIREAKYWLLYKDIKIKLSENSLKVLESRYLRKNEEGKIIETPQDLFKRVARNIAAAEKIYNPLLTDDEIFRIEEEFFKLMANLEFLPNSPTLMNAGNSLQQLSACFVLPIDDSLVSIFDALKYTALIHQSGGGTGFDFSRLRPKGDFVRTTSGIASGPVSFMKIFDATTEQIKQGSFRRGANMGILRVDHPDILEFIHSKEDNVTLSNFNISVAITDSFMDALENNSTFKLINPRTAQPVKEIKAQEIFDELSYMAWKTADPGIIFIDKMNDEKGNPVPKLGRIEATNPCGEVPMLAYESCNLGSINLNKILDFNEEKNKYEINWDKLMITTHKAVRFLDNVIDMSKYPLEQIDQMTRSMRRIGLGIMGWADMLIKLEIPYNSKEAYKLAEEVMSFIQNEAKYQSNELAIRRGVFPYLNYSIFAASGSRKPRNSALTTIAPTGTLSVIADCSSGIEPIFALAYVRKSRLNRNTFESDKEWVDLIEVNKIFEEISKREGFYSEELMKKVAETGSVQGFKEVPEKWREVFKVAHDLSYEDHIKMQAAFQKHVDNAVSKTINMPKESTIEDVKNAYLLAWKLGCKGITIYRDSSKDFQVLNVGTEKQKETSNLVAKIETKKEETNNQLFEDTKEGVSLTATTLTSKEVSVSLNSSQITYNIIDPDKDTGVCTTCD